MRTKAKRKPITPGGAQKSAEGLLTNRTPPATGGHKCHKPPTAHNGQQQTQEYYSGNKVQARVKPKKCLRNASTFKKLFTILWHCIVHFIMFHISLNECLKLFSFHSRTANVKHFRFLFKHISCCRMWALFCHLSFWWCHGERLQVSRRKKRNTWRW